MRAVRIRPGSLLAPERVVALVLILLVAGSAPPQAHAGAKRPRSWKTSGEILGPGLAGVTGHEWTFSCPSMPVTQGATDYIVEIPPEFGRGSAIAELRIDAVGPFGPSGRLWFDDASCGHLETGNELARVPAGTRFIDVFVYDSAQIEFELTLTIDPDNPLHDVPPESP